MVTPATYEKVDGKVANWSLSSCTIDSTQSPAMAAQHGVSRNDSSVRVKPGLKGSGRSSDLERFPRKAGFDAGHKGDQLHEGEAEAPVSGETAFRTQPIVDSARWDSWAADSMPGWADKQPDCRAGTGSGHSCTADFPLYMLEGCRPLSVVETASEGEHIAADCRRSARLAAAAPRRGMPVYDT